MTTLELLSSYGSTEDPFAAESARIAREIQLGDPTLRHFDHVAEPAPADVPLATQAAGGMQPPAEVPRTARGLEDGAGDWVQQAGGFALSDSARLELGMGPI